MTSTAHEFEIPCASIECVQRSKAGAVTTGDHAIARLASGIMQFLETTILGTEIPLGAGYHSRFTVPFGLAASAAYAVIAPMQSDLVSWTGFDVELWWDRPAQPGDTLLAEATIIAVDMGLASFDLSCRDQAGNDLLRGRLRLRALRDGKTLKTSLLSAPPPRRQPAEPRPRLAGYSLIRSIEIPDRLTLGARAPLLLEIANPESIERIAYVSLDLPTGAGVSLDDSPGVIQIEVPACSTTKVKWTIRADRPDEVNLGRPWPLVLSAEVNGKKEFHTCWVAVPDPRPRRIFYVLSEDCETFDGGHLTGNYGDSSSLGNANNFMDPEDYRIQMFEKPDRMNAIAERFGARFTHFWCAPQRFAVDWAAASSKTGEWSRLAFELDQSVRRGSILHEYAPHIHFDYEPDSRHPPQPRLIYDAATDGILPNDYYDPITNPRHHFHDWDGSGRGISYVKELGDLSESDSKAGSLRKSLSYLARMQANRRYPIIARTGGFDFGIAAEDQLNSTAAYVANGLRGNSDAFFRDREPSRSRLAYWCDARDRLCEIDKLDSAQLVQLALTRDTDFSDSSSDNDWFASSIDRTSESGVHIITAITHAMFMRGAADPFRSLEGGSFSGLEEHLRWVRTEYPEVEFATASEALLEFIDYYSPRIEASVSGILCGGNPGEGLYEYGIRLLGAGIRLDEKRPATVNVLAPPLFESCEIEHLRVTADGELINEASDFDPRHRPAVTVTLRSRPADLRLQVSLKPSAQSRVANLFKDARYVDPIESPRRPLFRMRSPWNGHLPTDVLRLLTNPISGITEPLGRRIHPWGVFLLGGALTGALETARENRPYEDLLQPSYLRIRWRKTISPESDTYVDCKEMQNEVYRVRIRDHAGDLVADGDIELKSSSQTLTSVPDDSLRRSGERLRMEALSRDLSVLRQRHSQTIRGIQDYEANFREVLTQYRRERAWKLMILARQLYVALIRRDWEVLLRMFKSRELDAVQEQLLFPNVFDFVETSPDSISLEK